METVTGYVVAYSGGMDSHVLLAVTRQAAARLAVPVRAIHVNHRLHPDAGRWQAHCVQVCAELGVPLQVIAVDAAAAPGQSPEACAREARYAALRQALRRDEVLLFAHHQDDQAETFLLQLLRGAGPRGLAAMPRLSAFAAGRLFRPFLPLPRTQLREFAMRCGLQWVEDPGNRDERYARNYLRHQVLPLLKARWPGLGKTISRSAQWCAQAQQLIERDSQALLAAARSAAEPRCLALQRLEEYTLPQQAQILRTWLQQLQLDRPGAGHLQQILQCLIPARQDAVPVVRWATTEVRRYRSLLYAGRVLPAADQAAYRWDITHTARLKLAHWVLQASAEQGRGLRQAACGGGLEVRFRHGGERCALAGGRHQSLKKRLQQLAVPPWERSRIPLLLLDGQVVAIGDRWISPAYTARGQEWGYVLVLTPR